jgi:hypothetical protein
LTFLSSFSIKCLATEKEKVPDGRYSIRKKIAQLNDAFRQVHRAGRSGLHDTGHSGPYRQKISSRSLTWSKSLVTFLKEMIRTESMISGPSILKATGFSGKLTTIDNDLEHGSDDPADPEQTVRVIDGDDGL